MTERHGLRLAVVVLFVPVHQIDEDRIDSGCEVAEARTLTVRLALNGSLMNSLSATPFANRF
ncbi:hypothetical protein [Cohnella faecalis]|uniref:Uncharacterized protein n=1 Tax=Cohnella faecalis TaxID=2315694 RepID=A0A398CD20_9BACL|nr:hypothetical protein [Cohnella faecalis]RIE00610.1 hypothetical protein D3H35_27510 [Cohnella faecalis]